MIWKHFSRNAIINIIEAVVFFASILVLIYFDKLTLNRIIWMTLIAQLVSIWIFLYRIRDYLVLKISWDWTKKILTYNAFMFIPVVSVMLFGVINRFLVKFFLGFEGLGYFEIYLYCAIGIIGVFLNIFFTAFLPHYIDYKDKKRVIKIINWIIIILAPFIIGGLLFASWIIITLFMQKSFFLNLALLCSFYGFIHMVFSIYDRIVKFYELKSLKSLNKGYILALIIIIICGLIFIPLYGITGAVISNTIGEIVLILYCRRIIKKDIINA